ncbi:MAG: CPBP family intramembrane metalloprotease [Methylococcaceae bacterium]|nr:CPBP family intramembrane metalloprotease [Methylococcaceae bacterium]
MPNSEAKIPNRKDFLNMAFWFEGSMVGVAWLIGWFVDVNPFANLSVDGTALFWGILGTFPLFLLFLVFYRFPVGPLDPIKNSLLEILGPVFSLCGWQELMILAIVAGISEEVLFRGLLQPWLEEVAGLFGGLILSNVIFGLLHWITPMYALIAGLIGFYLAYMMDITGSRYLLTPIVIHALYDFLAFLIVAEAYRLQQKDS